MKRQAAAHCLVLLADHIQSLRCRLTENMHNHMLCETKERSVTRKRVAAMLAVLCFVTTPCFSVLYGWFGESARLCAEDSHGCPGWFWLGLTAHSVMGEP